MRKRRLVYVRDSEGKFARVNSLLSKAKPNAAKNRSNKLNLSKPKRSKGNDTLPVVDIQEAKVSRGNLSYAIGPAKDLSSRYDLTGPDKSDSNQAAYREAKKIARELQLKYGDNAPSANLIYRVARNIQIGKFDPNDPNAAKPGEEVGSPTPKAPVKRQSPSAPKRTATAKPKLHRNAVVSQWIYEARETDKLGRPEDDYQFVRALSRLTNPPRDLVPWVQYAKEITDPDRKSGSAGDDYNIVQGVLRLSNDQRYQPEPPRVAKTPAPKPKKEFGPEITSPTDAQLERERLLKYQLDTWWMGAEDFYDDTGYKGPLDAIDFFFEHANDSLWEELGYEDRWDDKISSDRKLLQDLGSKEKMKARMRSSYERYLREDSIKQNMLYADYNEYDIFNFFKDSDESRRYLFQDAPISMTDVADELFKELREEGFDGPAIVRGFVKSKEPVQTGSKDLKPGDVIRLKRFEGSDPDFVDYIVKENDGGSRFKVIRLFPDYGVDPNKEKELSGGSNNVTYGVIGRKPLPDPTEGMTKNQKAAYDLRQEAKRLQKIADINEANYLRIMKTGINRQNANRHKTDMLANRERAKAILAEADDVEKNGPKSSFEDFVKRYETNPDAGKPDTKKTSRRGSEIQADIEAAMKKIDFLSNQSKSIPESELDAWRAGPEGPMEALLKLIALQDERDSAEPVRDRDVKDAKDIQEMVEIMQDRHPKTTFAGWTGPGTPLRRAITDFGTDSNVVRERVRRAMQAADDMALKYPEIPFDGFHARAASQFEKPNVIARCMRGMRLDIEFNVNFLTVKTPAGANKNKDLFHPANFEKDPHYATVVHEFGHSFDWWAHQMHDLYNSDYVVERRKAGDQRDAKLIWKDKLNEVRMIRDGDIREAIVKAHRDSGTELQLRTWQSFNTSGYAKENMEELIAESWQDYHTNGPEKCSPVSKAVTESVLASYETRRKKGIRAKWD